MINSTFINSRCAEICDRGVCDKPSCIQLNIDKEALENYSAKSDMGGLTAAAIFLPVSMIMGLSNYTGSSTSMWGIAWKIFAFAGLCALGHQSKKNLDVKESIQNAVKGISEASQVDKSKPIFVFINPHESSASVIPSNFYNEYYKDQVEKLSKVYQLYILEPTNKSRLLHSLNQFEPKSIKTMCIRAHADPSAMAIAPGFHLSAKHTNVIKAINDKMAKDSQILLLGCCTAKGKKNIAKDISRMCTDSTIYGAKGECTPVGTQIGVDGSHHIVCLDAHGYVKENKACVEIDNVKDVTRKYLNGEAVD